MTQSITYFVSGHTAAGYVHYLSSNLQAITNVIVLKYDDERVLTELFNKVAIWYQKNGYVPEIISGLSSKKTIAGVIIREKHLAILAQSIVQDPIPEATYLDFNSFNVGQAHIFDRKKENQLLQAAYDHFEKGLEIHDDLEAVYIQEMDFEKADQLAADFIDQLLRGKQKKAREPVVYERLFITNTPDGKVNHAKELIAPLNNVYYIKGRAGTGKSVFMKKVLSACILYGYDAEVYRCSFDPESIDMVIVRELNFAIFDSTPPHELSPEKGEGTVVDLYEQTVTKGTDEKHATKISQLTQAYQVEMKQGMQQLEQLNEVYGKPERNLQLEPAFQFLNNTINKNM